MVEKRLDEKIQESLLLGTENSLELKEEIWQEIEKNIKNNEKGEMIQMKRQKNLRNRRKKNHFKYGVAAAALLLFIGAGTETGQATFEKIKEFLVPEKVITEELEGMKEDTNVALNEGQMNYTIYFDEERYMMEKLEDRDKIFPRPVEGMDLSNIHYMEIMEEKNKTPKELASETHQNLQGRFKELKDIEEIKEPIDGIFLYGYNLGEKDDVERYYFIDNQQGGTFIIKQRMTFEALEGHGVRFDNMLKEFRIHKNQE